VKVVISWAGTKEVTVATTYDPEQYGIMLAFKDEAEKQEFFLQLSKMNAGQLCYLRCPKSWPLKIARKAFVASERTAQVRHARDANTCRICGKRASGVIVCNCGREYAHEECLKKEAQKKILRKKS
jgi:hypothetical protein